MNLYNIEIQPFKSKFFQVQLLNIVVLITTFIFVSNGVYLLANFDPGKKLTLPILGAMVILAGIHTQYQRRQLSRIVSIEDFPHRVNEYQKFYNFRLLWFLFACLISCGLAALTGRQIFAYYGVFDFVIASAFYPNIKLFKRELKNEEIIVH